MNIVLKQKLQNLLSKLLVRRITNLLELIHTSLCDNNYMLTSSGKYYFVTFVDNYSNFTHVYLHRNKDAAFEKFKIFKEKD